MHHCVKMPCKFQKQCDNAFRLQTGSSAGCAAQRINTLHFLLGIKIPGENTWR
jgi:hypothetical protein